MENKKKQLTEKELEQVMGGVLKPIQVDLRYCPYCDFSCRSDHDLDNHIKVCPHNPNNSIAESVVTL